MKKTLLILSFSLPFLLFSCASQYKQPGEKEPCAVVKVKTYFDGEKARSLLPKPRLGEEVFVEVKLKEKDKEYTVVEKTFEDILAGKGDKPEVLSFRVYPDRPVTIDVYLAVRWVVMEKQQVQKLVHASQSIGQKNTYEYQYVYEDVATSHGQGCHAKTTLLPEKDAVYILDYNNLQIREGCTVRAYRQFPQGEGKFRLVPVKEIAVEGEKPK